MRTIPSAHFSITSITLFFLSKTQNKAFSISLSLYFSFSMANRAVLLVFIVYLMVVVGSAGAVNLSLKLIHRFSDEAKALWLSRSANLNVNVDEKWWPKRNSLKNLELLFNNDLKKRQRMKLSSHYDLLFPSQGSKTLFFGNDFDW